MTKENTYILSVDIGKYETEVVGRNLNQTKDEIKTVRLRTRMYNLENGYIDLEGDSHKVKFNGEEYILGEQGLAKSNDTTKTQFLHQLCCYTTITQFLEPDTKDNSIYMTLACPLSVLQIKEAKEEYKSFIKSDGPIEIEVDNQHYTFTIKDITIKAEGAGIIYLEPTIFLDKRVAIIDLGGLNMGFSLYNNMTCTKENRFIEECGTDRLLDLVREQLSIYKNGNLVNKDTAEKALHEGGLKKSGKLDTDSIQFIDSAKNQYLNEVLNHVKAHKFNLDELDSVVFVGGTSQHVKREILATLDHAYIPADSQLSTVNGNYKVAIKKYGSCLV